MKKTLLFLSTLALLTFSSCIKENIEEANDTSDLKYNMIPVIFSAVSEQRATDLNDSPETKVILKDNAYQWEADTYVSVFTSSAPELNNQYKVLSSGLSTDFGEGSLPDTHKGPYYAVAPYNEANSMHTKVIDNADGTTTTVDSITVVVPAIQTAVEGSIPPETPFIAKSDNQEFTFKAVTGFIKFTMQMENIREVTFSGNNNEMLAGASDVKFGDDGKITNTINKSYPSSPTITLKMSDDGCFEVGKEYYIATRTFSFSKGITISYLDKDGNRCYKTSQKAPSNSVSRNRYMTIKSMGTMNTDTPNDLFIAWIHGFDIDFGGVQLNSKDYPLPVKLVTSGSVSDKYINFLNSESEISLSNSHQTIITARYADQRMKVKRKGVLYMTGEKDMDNYVFMKNLDVTIIPGTTSGGTVNEYMMINNTNADNAYLKYLVLDSVKIDVPADKHLVTSQMAKRAILNLIIESSDITVHDNNTALGESDSPVQRSLFFLTKNGTTVIENFIFKNNIVYSPDKIDGTSIPVTNFAFLNMGTVENIVFEHNTIVNVYPSKESRASFVNPTSVNSATFKNNLFYFDKYDTVIGNLYICLGGVNIGVGVDQTEALNNSVFADNYSVYDNRTTLSPRLKMGEKINDKDVDGGMVYKHAGDASQTVVTVSEFDFTNGIFMSADEKYGAQRDWSKYTESVAN